MYPLYIDYFSHISLSKRVGQVFNGGDNATKILLLKMMKSEYYTHCEQFLILHNGFIPTDEYEKEIIQGECFQKIYVDSLEEVHFKENAVLFIPVVCGREMIMVSKLKKKNPYIKVYGRIHDKNHNFPFDFYDRYFFSGLGRTGLLSIIDFLGKKVLFALKYNDWMKNFDKVFTVSNYSMQLLNTKTVKFINYYYCDTLDIIKNITPKKNMKNDFILFINGGRPEKNSLRTIEAFINYKSVHQDDNVQLFVTSITENVKSNLLKKLNKNKNYRKDDILFFEYLSYEKLYELLMSAKFLLFTSKGEGFGLPVLESAYCGRPILASRTTAVPEVLGASIRYVDPFSKESIIKGIEYYRNEDNLKYYEKTVANRLNLVKSQIKEDYCALIREIYEE